MATDGEPGTAHYVEPAEALAEPQDEPLVDALDTAHEADPGVDGFEWPLRTYPTFDDWDVEQSVRHLEARVGVRAKRANRPVRVPARAIAVRPTWRVDAAHAIPRAPHPPHPQRTIIPARPSFLARFVLLLSLVALAGGVGLLAWSHVSGRSDLWDLGLPLALVGQIWLLLGLALQLERIWHNSRYAARKLEQFDSRLHKLQRTASMMGATHGSAAQAFYSHVADNSDPQLLLADLKGQLDLVAASISRRSA